MIQLIKVNKIYNGLAGKVHALKDADLTINEGEKAVIIGKSGSGKSTLLNIISGIDRAESGEIIIKGETLHSMNESRLAKWRGKNIGIVFQFYQLLPTLTAFDNVRFAMDLVSVIPFDNRRSRAVELLERVGLGHKLDKFPNELSGGEVQRVAIARALANDPPVLVADEPTGNLDTATGNQIYELFDELSAQGKTLLIVTHENISERNFDKVIHITDGVLQKEIQYA